jgi:hypothetical protein
VASDIGRMGLRLESDDLIEAGQDIEIVFPLAADHVRCFGRVVWCRRVSGSRSAESGVALDSWHGIVLGGNSWIRYKGAQPKRDRRSTPR